MVPAGGADFGGEVGKRRDVVSEVGGGVGEFGSDELHPVARIACKSNDGLCELDARLGKGCGHEVPRAAKRERIFAFRWTARGRFGAIEASLLGNMTMLPQPSGG